MTHMNKNGRYKQRFSIRKYKFGAASVLLGTIFALGMTGTTAQAQHGYGSTYGLPYGPEILSRNSFYNSGFGDVTGTPINPVTNSYGPSYLGNTDSYNSYYNP